MEREADQQHPSDTEREADEKHPANAPTPGLRSVYSAGGDGFEQGPFLSIANENAVAVTPDVHLRLVLAFSLVWKTQPAPATQVYVCGRMRTYADVC
jgi:hypothetical protein